MLAWSVDSILLPRINTHHQPIPARLGTITPAIVMPDRKRFAGVGVCGGRGSARVHGLLSLDRSHSQHFPRLWTAIQPLPCLHDGRHFKSQIQANYIQTVFDFSICDFLVKCTTQILFLAAVSEKTSPTGFVCKPPQAKHCSSLVCLSRL